MYWYKRWYPDLVKLGVVVLVFFCLDCFFLSHFSSFIIPHSSLILSYFYPLLFPILLFFFSFFILYIFNFFFLLSFSFISYLSPFFHLFISFLSLLIIYFLFKFTFSPIISCLCKLGFPIFNYTGLIPNLFFIVQFWLSC